MQRVLISSGRGPIECELAVGLYRRFFLMQNPAAVVIKEVQSQTVTVEGKRLTGYSSVLLEIADSNPIQTGSVRWVCQSPVRKNHRRKNWFIVVSLMTEDDAPAQLEATGLAKANTNPRHIRIDTFRCPGKGGQNVNKVETGVRVTHIPTGMMAESVTARTQLGNRKFALERVREKIMAHNAARDSHLQKAQWTSHDQLERGNAFATFTGLAFLLVE